MTWETVTLSLFDGFFGAIVGGLVAAWIALRTARQAIAANAAAQDRDRALTASLRFREFITTYLTVGNAARGPLTSAQRSGLIQDQHLALKSAQFARHGDAEFSAWLKWVHDEIVARLALSDAFAENVAWLGDIARMLEARLFDGPGNELARAERPTEA